MKSIKHYFEVANNLAKIWSAIVFSPSLRDNKTKWKQLKGKYTGKRVFLIGNGPSLNKTPLYLLKNEYTLCFNRFDLMLERFTWHPSFYAMSDVTVMLDTLDNVKYMSKLCDKTFLKSELGNTRIDKIFPPEEDVLYFMSMSKSFSKNLPYTSNVGSTVAISGLQILNYLGFSEIYLIGVDMNYVIHKSSVSIHKFEEGDGEIIQSTADDDPNHFDPRYFGKGAKYSQPNDYIMNEMLTNMQRISEWFKAESNTVVKNAGYDSKLTCFEKVDFEKVLNFSKEQVDALFTEVVTSKGFANIDDINMQSHSCSSINEWDVNWDVVKVPTNYAVDIVKKVVLNYIPIGPYEGNVFFIKR